MTEFSKGDRVTPKSHGDHVGGTVARGTVARGIADGLAHRQKRASEGSRYLVRSGDRGSEALHKSSALQRASNR